MTGIESQASLDLEEEEMLSNIQATEVIHSQIIVEITQTDREIMGTEGLQILED